MNAGSTSLLRGVEEGSDLPVSARIRSRLFSARQRYHANDNISAFVMEGDTPGVASSLPGFPAITRRFLRSAAEGADTITWLAAAEEAAKATGLFWLDRAPHTTHVFPGTDPAPQERQAWRDALERLTSREPRS